MVKKKTIGKLANQLSYAAYQQFAPQKISNAYQYAPQATHMSNMAACQAAANEMGGYWHKMCNKFVGAIPRTAVPNEPETPSKRLMRLRRYLMRQRQPEECTKGNGGEKIMHTVNYAQYNNKLWNRQAANTMGMGGISGYSLPQHMLGVKQQGSDQTVGSRTSNPMEDYRPFNFGMCANKCLDLRDDVESETMDYVSSYYSMGRNPQQPQNPKMYMPNNATNQQTSFNPVSILKNRQSGGSAAATIAADAVIEPQKCRSRHQTLNDPRFLQSFMQAKDTKYAEPSELDNYVRRTAHKMYAQQADMKPMKCGVGANGRDKQLRAMSYSHGESSSDSLLPGVQNCMPSEESDCEEEELIHCRSTTSNMHRGHLPKQCYVEHEYAEKTPPLKQSSFRKEKHSSSTKMTLEESDEYEEQSSYKMSYPKKSSFKKKETRRKHSCSEITKSDSEIDEECIRRSRSKIKVAVKRRSKSCQSRLSADANVSDATEPAKRKHKNNKIDLEALGKFLRARRGEGDTVHKRKLNLSQLLKDNKLSDIKGHQLWDSLMQLVVQMCGNDFNEKATKTHSQRSTPSKSHNGDNCQKQYSIYLLVTSDEESETNDSSDTTLRAKKMKKKTVRLTDNQNDSEEIFEHRCATRYNDEHRNLSEKTPVKSTTTKSSRSKSKQRSKSVLRNEKHTIPIDFDVPPPIYHKFRPPLHWPKRDYSKPLTKSTTNKTSNRSRADQAGKTKRVKRASGAAAKNQSGTFNQRYWQEHGRPSWSTGPRSGNSMSSKAYSQMFTYPLSVAPEVYSKYAFSSSRR